MRPCTSWKFDTKDVLITMVITLRDKGQEMTDFRAKNNREG